MARLAMRVIAKAAAVWTFSCFIRIWIVKNGAAGRDRTCDLSLRRQTLFQLSYNGVMLSLGQVHSKL